MGAYDKRMQREELGNLLRFLSVDDRDRVLDALDGINEHFDVSRIYLKPGDKADNSMELLELFLDAKQVQGCTPKTIKHYRYVLTQMHDMMEIPFVDMTTHEIMTHFARLETDFLLSASTRSSHRSAYNSLFTWLYAEEFIERNPMLRIPPIKVPKTIRKPYSPKELARLEGAAWNPDDSRDLAIIHFLRSTACRISEACQLNRDDVDMASKRVKVCGKGEKERFLHFDEEAELYLSAYLAEREDDDPALFHGRQGRLSPDGVRRMLKRVAARANVQKTHPHRFRRTQATNLLRKGMPLEKVSKLLGHDNLDTTMTYIYLDDEDIAADYKKYA